MKTFFSSEILQYWEILCEYINPFSIFMWGIIGGVIGFLVTIGLMIYFRKKILIPRRHWTLKVLAYCYLIFFPLYIGFCATQWAALHNCEKQIVQNIPKYLGETNELFNKYLKAEVIKIISEEKLQSTGHELLDEAVGGVQKASGVLLKSVGISELNSTKEAGVGNAFASYITSILAETDVLRKYVVTEVKKQVGKNVLLMNEEATNEFFDIEVAKVVDSGILNTVLEKHVNNLFGSFKLNVWLMLLLGIALPIIEIVIACYLFKSDRKEQQLANNEPSI
ncbi:hypothetical protein [Bacteroides sp. 224]|uniref:hypothetical protein n=1 Tax=Bacteroides sp. 224 TaxID=2302936 RepID=UPI0013CF7145|nr:hypothetical protein [Bacteroides sp. 224]NDV65759.1 hypothetical protein [Bacteroides sp. 224]